MAADVQGISNVEAAGMILRYLESRGAVLSVDADDNLCADFDECRFPVFGTVARPREAMVLVSSLCDELKAVLRSDRVLH